MIPLVNLCKTCTRTVAKIIAILFFISASFSANTSETNLGRNTQEGMVIGFENKNNTISFQGIPYAQAPINHLRWKAPLPPEKRQLPLRANNNDSMCPQLAGPLSSMNIFKWNSVIGNEDCLHLNITAPGNIASDQKLPVMVWIHGGGNSIGYKGNAAYHGEQLAQQGQVIVVSINYRLGPLGWFYHPALNEAAINPADRSGNYGTLDIIQALIWVKNNIENFGGDPNKVTVFGESAGGFNVYTLLISPQAKGLFHRAIVQSGGLRTTTHEYASGLSFSPDQESNRDNKIQYSDNNPHSHPFSASAIVSQLLLDQGLAQNVDQAFELQKNMDAHAIANLLYQVEPEKLLPRYPSRAAGMINFPSMFKDGFVFPMEEPERLFTDSQKFNVVPVMLGTNRDENKVFMALDPEQVNWRMKIKDLQKYNRTSKYLSDNWKAKGVDEFASLLADSQGQTYAYRFDWDELPKILDMDLAELIGAGHGLEIPFVFGSLRSDFNIHLLFDSSGKERRKKLSDAMLSYWSQFAYTGNPGQGLDNNLPQWLAWDNHEKQNKFMILDAGDQGIKMSHATVTQTELKARLAADESFTDQKERCQLYQTLFIRDDFLGFDEQEYNDFGAQGCKDVPLVISRP